MFSGRMRFYLMLAICGTYLASIAPSLVRAGGVGTLPAGVEVSPEGVFRTKLFRDPGGMVSRRRAAAARATLSPELTRPSKLRKISLNRLEAAIAQLKARGEFETDEMKYLAGLTQITHVFFYPKTNDIVIAGPAEGFFEHINGRVMGIETGKAILELQDLVTALRAYPPAGDQTSVISVSIDPTQEGLQRMQQYLVNAGGRATPGDTRRIVADLQKSLGQQTVSLQGISPKTHFAQVLVEADYRMKLIGIGLERTPVRIKTYVERAKPGDVSRNAMQRWYFVPNYKCVRVTEDDLGMQLEGSTIKLVGADEMVSADGVRVAKVGRNKASREFTESFTKNYDKMAEQVPVYGQLRNMVDMSITAAFIQRMDYYGQAGWNMDFLGNEENYQVETYTAPRKVETAVNAIWKGRTLMTPIGGGVEIHPTHAIHADAITRETDGRIDGVRRQIDTNRLDKIQWWWD